METLDVQRIKALIREGEVRPTRSSTSAVIALSLHCTRTRFVCTVACSEDMCLSAYRCSIVNALQGYQGP